MWSDKSIKSDKIHLNENGELINSESKTAEVLNKLTDDGLFGQKTLYKVDIIFLFILTERILLEYNKTLK